MDYVKKVNNLCLSGSLSDNWRRFKQNYDIFEEAAGIKTQPEKKRIASFLNTIGEDALELFNGFDMSEKDRQCYAKIQNAFEKHCTTKKRIVYERFNFFARRQSDEETLKSYLADLTKMAVACEFKDQEASLIRDQFVSGITDKALQADLLLFEDDLNFDKIVELLELLSVAKHHYRKQVLTADLIIVNEESLPNQPVAVTNDSDRSGKAYKEDKVVDTPNETPKEEPEVQPAYYYGENPCKRCNFKHKFRECPAFGKKCLKCFQLNHFANCCHVVKTDDFKNPCMKCNSKHKFRNCPAFGKNCSKCFQMNHFAVNCPKRKADL